MEGHAERSVSLPDVDVFESSLALELLQANLARAPRNIGPRRAEMYRVYAGNFLYIVATRGEFDEYFDYWKGNDPESFCRVSW